MCSSAFGSARTQASDGKSVTIVSGNEAKNLWRQTGWGFTGCRAKKSYNSGNPVNPYIPSKSLDVEVARSADGANFTTGGSPSVGRQYWRSTATIADARDRPVTQQLARESLRFRAFAERMPAGHTLQPEGSQSAASSLGSESR
jgi:hypothetical protein